MLEIVLLSPGYSCVLSCMWLIILANNTPVTSLKWRRQHQHARLSCLLYWKTKTNVFISKLFYFLLLLYSKFKRVLIIWSDMFFETLLLQKQWTTRTYWIFLVFDWKHWARLLKKIGVQKDDGGGFWFLNTNPIKVKSTSKNVSQNLVSLWVKQFRNLYF